MGICPDDSSHSQADHEVGPFQFIVQIIRNEIVQATASTLWDINAHNDRAIPQAQCPESVEWRPYVTASVITDINTEEPPADDQRRWNGTDQVS